jgi:hypothetical protein
LTDTQRRRRLDPLLSYWKKALGLQNWQITYEIRKGIDAVAVGGQQVGGAAFCSGPYALGHIVFTRDLVDKSPTTAELERAVVHELGHFVIHPLVSMMNDERGDEDEPHSVHCARELLVEHLSAAFMSLRRGDEAPIYSPSGKEK